MKKYTMSFAQACEHKPEHPERTARKNLVRRAIRLPALVRSPRDIFDVTYQVWPSREAMLKTLEMQGRREYRADDWKECKSEYRPGSMYKPNHAP